MESLTGTSYVEAPVWALGAFRLDVAGEVLCRDGAPLPLGRRAVALLIRLLRQPGEIVGKDALMEAGWHGTIVEESNLTTQISSLRRVLNAGGGEGWLETLPRRGYRWIGPIGEASAEAGTPPSVAVLPFDVRDPTLEEFAEGVADEVISQLSGLRDVVVVSRASTQAVHRQGLNPLAAGRALGVRYIVTGTVRRGDGRLRIAAELAECSTGLAVWSRGFASADDVEPTPETIVARIVNTLAPRVRESELRRLAGRAPSDLTVHQLLLRARMLLASYKLPALEAARPLINDAIARDPGCAPAHALRAEWHSLMISQGWTTNRAEDLRALETSAIEAIALDGGNAAALARIGHCRAGHYRDFEGARVLLDRAIDTGPTLPKVWELSSIVLSWMGDGAGAIRHAERARQLSPYDPFIFQVMTALALGHYVDGQYAAAIDWTWRSHAAQPRPGMFLLAAAASAAALGKLGDARETMDLVLRDHPTLRVANIVERLPFRDPARRQAYGAHLSLAGCPA